ncbi:MAG: phosphotransferase [Opitutales bacterium]|jgi:N-acetylmuramate 1-kinase
MEEGEDLRRIALQSWLDDLPGFRGGDLVIASADASFRRYFRLTRAGQTFVVMDAPPEKEPCEPFVRIAELLLQSSVRVPEILAQDLDQGFLVLTDFGDLHYQEALAGPQRDALYDLALTEILNLQTKLLEEADHLPDYNENWVRMELEIFREWCHPDCPEKEYREIITPLVTTFLEQPRVFVHRDFHCRNLLLQPDGQPGVIDFQGALHGPVTYDPVSLLRDCYVANDDDWVQTKAFAHKDRLADNAILSRELDNETFLRWFDFVGLQRHLKCVGIFHRLHLRDGKDSYLADLPIVLGYVEKVISRWPELAPLRTIVSTANIIR